MRAYDLRNSGLRTMAAAAALAGLAMVAHAAPVGSTAPGAAQGAAPGAPGAVMLVPHLAVYDLRLLRTSGKRSLDEVRGRILYDFSGSACEGYALQFRQVSELDSGEGKVVLSDLRSTTWEDGAGKSFRFNSQNFIDQARVDAVDGRAKRGTDRVEVQLDKPKQTNFAMAKNMVFPTEHMRLIIEAARAGKTILEEPVYDGSDGGEKIYSTLTVIGREIAPEQKRPTDAAADKRELAALKRWPVTISYFDRAKKASGEETPAYSIGFELYENGISRDLKLDYGDFVLAGTMSQLEVKDVPKCQ